MPNLQELRHVGEHIVSESNGTQSREEVVVAQTGAAILSGTVMGKITASGKYKPYASGNSDGSQTAAGVLYSQLNAQTGDAKAVLHVRNCEVSSANLTGLDANARTNLAALGVIVR
ncbi:head decoration [Curvibacter phage PCA1]|nr:head decoration [Curvibacter phage PCA1]